MRVTDNKVLSPTSILHRLVSESEIVDEQTYTITHQPVTVKTSRSVVGTNSLSNQFQPFTLQPCNGLIYEVHFTATVTDLPQDVEGAIPNFECYMLPYLWLGGRMYPPYERAGGGTVGRQMRDYFNYFHGTPVKKDGTSVGVQAFRLLRPTCGLKTHAPWMRINYVAWDASGPAPLVDINHFWDARMVVKVRMLGSLDNEAIA